MDRLVAFAEGTAAIDSIIPVQLAGRVWSFPGDPDPYAIRPAVALVADDRGSVIVDAGPDLALARAALDG